MGTTAAAKRGPYATSLRRRARIAASMLELVDELGYDAVTTAMVAARSGTAEPTVVYHYPTKDQLLIAALELADDLSLAESELGHPEGLSLDLEAMRRSATSGLIANERRLRLYMMIRGKASTVGHPAVEYVRARTGRSVGVFAALIEQRQAAGLAHPDLDSSEVARQLTALWEGLTAMWFVDDSIDIGTLLVDGVRRLSLEGLMSVRALVNVPGAAL